MKKFYVMILALNITTLFGAAGSRFPMTPVQITQQAFDNAKNNISWNTIADQIKKGSISITTQDAQGKTLLMYAADALNLDAIEMLSKFISNPVGYFYIPPKYFAEDDRFLLNKYKNDVMDIKDNDGYTALAHAIIAIGNGDINNPEFVRNAIKAVDKLNFAGVNKNDKPKLKELIINHINNENLKNTLTQIISR